MVYRKRVKIKGQEYWYLFHTIREGNKFVKRARYIGKTLPGNINEVEEDLLKEIKNEGASGEKVYEKKDEKIINSLHPLERKVIPFLGLKTLGSIIKKSGLSEVEVLRAIQWLENKKIVKSKKESKEVVELGDNGKRYKKEGLPEKRFLDALDAPLEMRKLMEKAKLDKDELYFSIGLLKKRNLIEIGKEIKRIKKEKFDDAERFLNSLPRAVSDLDEKDKKIMEDFRKRKEIIEVGVKKDVSVELTEL